MLATYLKAVWEEANRHGWSVLKNTAATRLNGMKERSFWVMAAFRLSHRVALNLLLRQNFATTQKSPLRMATLFFKRLFHFEARKIGLRRARGKITETHGQLLYEWRHLQRKLKRRDPKRLGELPKVPTAHPLFKIVRGEVREWEKVK